MKNLIGISGKIGSGKDLIGYIITTLINDEQVKINHPDSYAKNSGKGFDTIDMVKAFVEGRVTFPSKDGYPFGGGWTVKKFAYKLKQIVSILTGIPVGDLEKPEVKDRILGDEWIRYSYAIGHTTDNNGNKAMIDKQCDKEVYEYEKDVNWQTAYKRVFTVRDLLQLIGTEAMRDVIHENVWINALFTDYKENEYVYAPLNAKPLSTGIKITKEEFDKMIPFNSTSDLSKVNCASRGILCGSRWIITDVRFPNELKAIKDRGGILIRVNRNHDFIQYSLGTNKGTVVKFDETNPVHVKHREGERLLQHASETALDNAEFDYTIDNSSSIEELVKKVKQILIKEGII